MRNNAFVAVPAILPVLLSVSVALSGINTGRIIDRVLFAGILTAMPGIVTADDAAESVTKTAVKTYDEEMTVTEKDSSYGDEEQTSASVNKSVTIAVPTETVGSIIKRTLSPYSASVSSNNVYMSNKTGQKIDVSGLLSSPLGFTVEKYNDPQILIYHTHTTEAYMENEEAYLNDTGEPRTTDPAKNIVAVGDIITAELEKAGYSVVHDSTIHDYPAFTGCYSRSAETVKKYLKEYPSIKIAIDVHRDSISGSDNKRIAPVVNIDGRDAAQVMLVMGSETGNITGYPDWKENLKLALKLQNVFEEKYPSFARSVSLKSAKYNQNLTTGSILIEMGSDANTFGQALYSGELVGKALVLMLDSQ